jgi:hypothetical protein
LSPRRRLTGRAGGVRVGLHSSWKESQVRRVRIGAAVIAASVAAVPALAGVSPPPNFSGKFDAKSSLGFTAVSRHGRTVKAKHFSLTVKVKHFSWDGLNCGHDRFTAGLLHSIKVKDDSFSDTQPVAGVSASIKATVHGEFRHNETRAKGTLRLKGACRTKQSWTAKRSS